MVWKQRTSKDIADMWIEGFTQYTGCLNALRKRKSRQINGLRLMLETNANCGSTGK
jgi:hypothetical protein